MFFSELVSFFSEVRFCFGHYIVPFSVGAESSTREHSRTVQQSLGAGLKVDFFFFFLVLSFVAAPRRQVSLYASGIQPSAD